MKPTTVFLILILSLVTGVAFGTAQAPDVLTYRGKTYYIHSNPLTPYFESAKVQRPRAGGGLHRLVAGLYRGVVHSRPQVVPGRRESPDSCAHGS
jgi:hypothetical protein